MPDTDFPTPHGGERSASDQPTIDDAWLRGCVRALHADGASLLLNTNGTWRDAVSTDDTAATIATLQLATGQGPGVQALLTGLPVQIPHWAHDAHHWPQFAAGLAATPVGALYALPLHVERDDPATTLGVLHIYRTAPGPLDPRTLTAVWLTAETVAATLALG